MNLHHFKEGILPINKPKGKTAFSLVSALRKVTGVKKIGHAGTLDPFATGVMLLLVGKQFTKQSAPLMNQDKEYEALVRLGEATDTYDCDGTITASSEKIPSLEEIQYALIHFQGEVEQIPPMYSAKKVGGKKLYELARKGIEIERKPIRVQLQTTLIEYQYPLLKLKIHCSKGTYVRTIADDLGKMLGCFAHLQELTRTRCGAYTLAHCLDGSDLFKFYSRAPCLEA